MYKYPVYQPALIGKEQEYVLDCLQSNWISSKGEYIGRFEEAFAASLKIKHATSVCNGTVALHLAMLALGIGPGDEVITPTLTYIASVNSISYVGATPVFCDSEKSTWQMDPALIEGKITKNTKAILVVHLYGQATNMAEVMQLAKKHGLFVIEDCAEAIGTKFLGKAVGTFGDISTFSFFGNKTITTGEGGMVVTNDETLFERCKHFKGQGLAKHREYWHDVVGYNFRMTNIAAAIGLAQLENLSYFVEEKQRVADTYIKNIDLSKYEYQERQTDRFHTYWMFSILVKNAEDREGLRAHLKMNKIETRPLFYPVHTMPMYSQRFQRHIVAEDLGWRGINLPSYPALLDEQIVEICQILNSYGN
ncbi:perosamine synthetase [Pelobium manganitolerans]|uniref:GDP-perosamine synthase n=1 Tax=Pelobium manganitolerans TaxID=1842495 RepID=A0A419S1P0_9SPHI|nr:DegT/DnrJ/EryC1/StrS family aminotransferase [Pelobium manganitolerans]RKD12402.1 perosamine synthetase [Pelobium manganitolerans]